MAYPNIFPQIPYSYYFNDAVGVAAGKAVDVAGDTKGVLAPVVLYMHLVNTTAAAAYLQAFGQLASFAGVGSPAWVFRLNANESREMTTPWLVPAGTLASNKLLYTPPSFLSIAGTTTPNGNTQALISVQMIIGFLRLSPTGGTNGGQ